MKGKRMKITQSDKIKDRIIKKSIIICVIFIFIIFSCFMFIINNKTKNIEYIECGNVDYNITLKQNDFFEKEILPSNNQYISALIDNINIDFDYNLKMKDMYSDYKYKYRIEANTKVIEKTTQNNIYEFKEDLKEEEINPSSDNFKIENNVDIDYQQYDSIIKKLISTYELNNIECKTFVTLYVDIMDGNSNIKDTSKLSVIIPLNVKTANIELVNDIDSSEEKIFKVEPKENYIWIYLGVTIVLLIFEVIKIVDLIKDIKRNCPKEVVDDFKFKRILREYKPYIQKINSGFDMSKYSIIRMETFEDMVRIREITQHPILMFENETKTKTYFIITTTTNMIYTFEVNHGNIKEISN